MAQGIMGGATSYEEQSLGDILSDIDKWIIYTSDRKKFIIEHKERLHKNKFWDKIPFDFQLTILTTISYFDTILFDLELVRTAIPNNCITEREVKLLRNIGRKAVEYNNEYSRIYKGDRYWHDYGNPNFRVAEEIYGKGRDYFVTMQDAGNAAYRLEDYMEKGQITNNTLNISGSVTGTQIQQGSINSSQTMSVENDFDYEKVITALDKIQRIFRSVDFQEDFGEYTEEIKKVVTETIEMVQKQEEHTKIKKALTTIKDIAMRVTSSVIASGIIEMIKQLPIW